MSIANRIVLTPDRGHRVEGIVNAGEEFYPGMIVQMDATQATQGNRFVHKIYDRAADGDRPLGPHVVVCEDLLQGRTTAQSYAAGLRFFGFIPEAGCELHLLYKNVTGTADDLTKGTNLIVDDGTGKVIATTGTPQTEVAVALETITDPTADTLVHCIWNR